MVETRQELLSNEMTLYREEVCSLSSWAEDKTKTHFEMGISAAGSLLTGPFYFLGNF